MPAHNDERRQLERRIKRQVKRMEQAEKEHKSILAQTKFVGTLGLLFVLPIVGGAYLGVWLDSLAQGYSARWTLGMIFVGLVIGAVNVYLFIRE